MKFPGTSLRVRTGPSSRRWWFVRLSFHSFIQSVKRWKAFVREARHAFDLPFMSLQCG